MKVFKKPIKTSYGTAILGTCFLLTLLFINWASKQIDPIALYIPAGSQVAVVSDFNSSLVAYYTFDDTTNDSAGSNHGTAQGGPTYVDGKVGRAMQFDGVDDSVAMSSILIDQNTVTVCVWAKPVTAGVNSQGVMVGTVATRFYISAGKWGVTSNSGGNAARSASSIVLGSWQHVCGVRLSSGLASVYVNGILDGAINQNSGTPGTFNIKMKIGNRGDGGNSFDGSLDDVRIYNRALSPQEISDLYALGSATLPPPPSLTNGSCSTILNTCTAGSYTDTQDSSTNYLWSCTGSNGGITAQCSIPISQSDTTPPTISNIQSTSITTTGATITWTTSEPADTQIDYGLTTTYGSQTTLNSQLSTSHLQQLSNLSPNTIYHYRVRSRDGAGNLGQGGDQTVTTSQMTTSGNRVDQLNSQGSLIATFTTIQACTNKATVGDTCDVYPGRYDERIILKKNSGTPSNPIIIQAHNSAVQDGQSMLQPHSLVASANPTNNAVMRGFWIEGVHDVVVKGFEITDIRGFVTTVIQAPNVRAGIYLRNSRNITIKENYLHELEPDFTLGDGIGGDGSNSYVKVVNNLLFKVEGIGLYAVGDHWLVDGNDISRGRNGRQSDNVLIIGDTDASRFFGFGHIFRNNYWHDYYYSDQLAADGVPAYPMHGPHIDAFMTFANGGPFYSYNNIVENNVIKNMDDQVFISNDAAPGNNYVHHITFRNNTVNNVSYIGGYGTGGSYLFNIIDLDYFTLINNTIGITNPVYYNGHPFRAYQMTEAQLGFAGVKGGSHHMTVKNNIFFPSGTNNNATLDAPSIIGTVIDYNLWYPKQTWPLLQFPLQDAHSLLGVDPKFVNSSADNFNLQTESPAIDAGSAPTQVSASDSGSGTILIVDNAAIFQDGSVGVNPDWIAIGGIQKTAQIVSINYATNAITINVPLSRVVGEGVYLYKNSNGTQVLYGSAPDIGAYEYTDNVTPPNPDTTPPTIPNISVPSATITSSSAIVRWNTDEPTTSRVQYGLALPSYGSFTSFSALTTAPSFTLSNLAPNTVYHYRVISTDASGNTSTSLDGTFSTLPSSPSNDTDGDGVLNVNDKCGKTPTSIAVNSVGCPLPKLTRFTVKPTTSGDLNSSSFDIGTTQGKVTFTNAPLVKSDGNYLDVDSYLTIAQSLVTLNSTLLPELNRPATITLYNITLTTPKILKDGIVCSSSVCTNVNYNRSTKILSFTVPSFSTYSIIEGTDPTPSTNVITVSKSGSGTGTVTGSTSSPQAGIISCGSDCSDSVTSGNSITLTATASSDSTFTGWSRGYCSGTGVCTFSPIQDSAVIATFTVISPVSSGGDGGLNTPPPSEGVSFTQGPLVNTIPSLCTPFISPFLRSLTLGSTGNDVKALQVFLNGKGYTIAYAGPGSKGNESTYFGPATTKALSRFQSVNNIYPALGYFGTLTMAKVKALSSTTACTSTSTPVITLPTNTTKFYFTRSLTLGSTGTDVKSLQQYLNSKGYTIASTGPGSPGNETDFFGGLTKQALARFQKTNNINPPLGFFGPVTRAYIVNSN